MQTKKNTLNLIGLMGLGILVLNGCSTEENAVSSKHTGNKNLISYSQFKRETGIQNLTSVLHIPKLDNVMAKDQKPEEFLIDTLAITTAIAENKTTYTFRVYALTFTPEENKVFNLVFRKQNDLWEKAIISFKIRLLENTKLCEEIEKIYDSQYINTMNKMCIGEYYYINCDGSCNGECDGFACPTGQCISHHIVVEPCPFEFTADTGDGTNPGAGGPPIDSGTNIGGGPDGNTNPAPTSPIGSISNEFEFIPNTHEAFDHGFDLYDTADYLRSLAFHDSLTEEQQTWADNHSSQYFPICNMFLQNYSNNDLYDLAVDMINHVMIDGTVDVSRKIIYDSTFKNTKIDCVHSKMMNNPSNWTLYKDLLDNFNSDTGKNITFVVGETPPGEWGCTTRGSNPQNYTVTISNEINDTGSNLMRMVTIIHEVMHAYMLSTLEAAQLITFGEDGHPIFNRDGLLPSYLNINLSSSTLNDKWIIFMYGLNASGHLSENWTHELFSSTVFSTATFRERLQNYIYNTYDWAHEDPVFIANAQSVFGATWKMEVAKAVSYIGLSSPNNMISDYDTYLNSYMPASPAKFQFISDIKFKIQSSNSDCP